MPRKHYVPKCKSTYPGNEEKVSVFTSPTNIDESENESEYHQIPYMRCIARFGISHYLAFAWSLGRMQIHANAFSSFMSSFLHLFF